MYPAGRCWRTHEHLARGSFILSAQAMPPLEPTGEVEAWISITAEGGICFFRRNHMGELESSGLMPREALHIYVSEYCAATLFLPQELTAPTCATIIYRASKLPEDMSGMLQAEWEAEWHAEGAGTAEQMEEARANDHMEGAGTAEQMEEARANDH